MNTQEMLIAKQQQLIDNYKLLLEAHKDRETKLMEYIAGIFKLLESSDNGIRQVGMDHLYKLINKHNKETK